jgi:hypothetical protein
LDNDDDEKEKEKEKECEEDDKYFIFKGILAMIKS